MDPERTCESHCESHINRWYGCASLAYVGLCWHCCFAHSASVICISWHVHVHNWVLSITGLWGRLLSLDWWIHRLQVCQWVHECVSAYDAYIIICIYIYIHNYIYTYIYIYVYIYIMHVVVIHNLLVVWNLFFHILGIIIPTGFHIFQRVENHQPDNIGYTGHPWLSMDIIFFKPPYLFASSPKPGALSDEVDLWLDSWDLLHQKTWVDWVIEVSKRSSWAWYSFVTGGYPNWLFAYF